MTNLTAIKIDEPVSSCGFFVTISLTDVVKQFKGTRDLTITTDLYTKSKTSQIQETRPTF